MKERLEGWLEKVFGESFPFEKEPWVEDGGVLEGDDEGGRGEKEEAGADFKGDILRLRGKTGFFELNQVFTCDIDL